MDNSTLTLVLVSATLLVSLTAGFLLAFAIVAMPGLKRLSDPEFIRAFQVIDGVIQNRQPIFMVVWLGSVVTLLCSGMLGIGQLDGAEGVLLICAVLTYLLGVQLPTLAINVPLNNNLQNLAVSAMDEPTLRAARKDFEPRWNRWNAIRTTLASLASVQLILLLYRL